MEPSTAHRPKPSVPVRASFIRRHSRLCAMALFAGLVVPLSSAHAQSSSVEAVIDAGEMHAPISPFVYGDRESERTNSMHVALPAAVYCLNQNHTFFSRDA